MLINFKSHLVNIFSLFTMWFIFLAIVAIGSVIAIGAIKLIVTLELSFFWIIVSAIFVPPLILWFVWLRKYP